MQILVNSVKAIHPLHIVILVTQNVLDVLVHPELNANSVCIVTMYQVLLVATVILDVLYALVGHTHSAPHA